MCVCVCKLTLEDRGADDEGGAHGGGEGQAPGGHSRLVQSGGVAQQGDAGGGEGDTGTGREGGVQVLEGDHR